MNIIPFSDISFNSRLIWIENRTNHVTGIHAKSTVEPTPIELICEDVSLERVTFMLDSLDYHYMLEF